MKIQVDHIFIFTSKDAPEAGKLVEAGFLEGPRRVHTGQGTSNGCFFFDNMYLELIWVHDVDEARRADISLVERSSWKQSGYCPFGIGLRTVPDNSALPDIIKTSDYNPPYLPKGASIRTVDNPDNISIEPELFFIPFSRKVSDEWRAHKNGVRDITAIKIVTPHFDKLSPQARYFQDLGVMSFRKGEKYLLELGFDNLSRRKTVDLRPDIPAKMCL